MAFRKFWRTRTLLAHNTSAQRARMRSAAVLGGAALATLALCAPPAHAAFVSVSRDPVGSGPTASTFRSAAAYPHPEANPPGANAWGCRPTAAHPNPVVLVHGTWESAYQTWAGLAPKLAALGFCVFAPNVGILPADAGGGVPAAQNGGEYGAGPVDESAAQLAAFVARVRAATHADKVDLIGHSQGGVIARDYLRFHGGAGRVARVVTMVATNHGTTFDGLVNMQQSARSVGIDVGPEVMVAAGAAGADQEVGSKFITTLNRGGDTEPGIAYTALASRYDEITTPYTSTFLAAGPGATVHNVVIQDGCTGDHTDHTDFTYSPRAQSLAMHALDPAVPIRCVAR